MHEWHGGLGTVRQHGPCPPGRSGAPRSAHALRDYATRGMMRIATMFATLIIGLIAGPAVSL